MIKFLSGLFPGIGLYGYLFAAGISAALAIGATYKIVHTANEVEILGLQKAIETKRANDNGASLKQLQDFIAGIHIAQTNYQSTLDKIAANTQAAANGWKNAVSKPLPPDCVPTADRMWNVSSAILSANKATAAAP